MSNVDGAGAPASTGHENGALSSAADDDFDMPIGDDLDSIDLGGSGSEGGGADAGAPGSLAGVPPASPPSVPQVQPVPGSPTGSAPPVSPQATPTPAPQTQQPTQGQQPTPPSAPQAPEAAAGPPPDFLTLLAQHRDAVVDELTSRFTIREEDIELLQTQPEAVLPRLAANVLYQAIESAHRQIMEYAPAVIDRHIAITNAQRDAETAFYEKWPGLKGLEPGKHQELRKIIQTYVQVNPQATQEQRISAIGAMAHQVLGIPLPASPAQGGRKKAAAAFTPAVSSLPGSAQPQGNSEEDQWAGFELPNTG